MNLEIDNQILINESGQPDKLIILAHGSGAGMNHPFMEELTEELVNIHSTVIRFNFSYMNEGKKFPGEQKKSIKD